MPPLDKTVKGLLAKDARQVASVADFEAIAEKHQADKLTAFFAQWVDGTGEHESKMKYKSIA